MGFASNGLGVVGSSCSGPSLVLPDQPAELVVAEPQQLGGDSLVVLGAFERPSQEPFLELRDGCLEVEWEFRDSLHDGVQGCGGVLRA